MPLNASSSKINFPFSPQLQILFKHLLKNGNELRIVGGAVRDFLVDKTICDIDLACKYLPEETIKILTRYQIKTINSGIKYGTITAVIDDQQFQITTLRKDIKNFGRDCQVEFIDDFYQDAQRRDFTINALSTDQAGNLYDYFAGQEDLKNKTVRFIGDAESRIKEDYLRILRFFRFSCFYGQAIDNQGLLASIAHKEQIVNLSSERIRAEFFKILSCPDRDNLWLVLDQMNRVGILAIMLGGEVNLTKLKNLLELEKILNQQFRPLILLAAISYNSKINLSRFEKKYLQIIAKIADSINFKLSTKEALELLLDSDVKMIFDALVIRLISSKNLQILIDDFLRISKIISTAKIPDFPVDGNDLIAAGFNPVDIGSLLKIAQKHWLASDFLIDKSQIINFLSTNKFTI